MTTKTVDRFNVQARVPNFCGFCLYSPNLKYCLIQNKQNDACSEVCNPKGFQICMKIERARVHAIRKLIYYILPIRSPLLNLLRLRISINQHFRCVDSGIKDRRSGQPRIWQDMDVEYLTFEAHIQDCRSKMENFACHCFHSIFLRTTFNLRYG